MKSFKINEFITLKLERGKTVIYVADERFQQCKFLLLNIPIDEVSSFNDIESVDETAESLSRSLEPINEDYSEYIKLSFDIPPETEFWGHCSNLQVWAENNYDTRILMSDLAFPLLKKLTDVGDPLAKKVFKEEIAKRLSSGYYNVIEYLFEQDYIKYLGNKELWKVIIPSLEKLRKNNYQVRWWVYNTELPLLLLRRLVDVGDNVALQLLKEIVKEILQSDNLDNIQILYDGGYIKFLTREEFWRVFGEDGTILQDFESQINAGRMKKDDKDLCYFNLSNGVYIEAGPMVFTYKDGHISGIGIWSDDKEIFEINRLPIGLYQLTCLEELVFSRVSLKEIPSGIKNLVSLKSLSLTENLLNNIPEEICNLVRLEYLGLGWNKLIILPKCLERLNQLTELHIFDNPLDHETKIFLKKLEEKREGLIMYLDSP